mmetsp:Transcript_2080/g.4795  ORF Transcript_2080/g.4795 Transcript_2080/m.4795 type:complete len:154 (+) Transcript_2080:5284-5745(+)
MRGQLSINGLGLRQRIDSPLSVLTVNGCGNEVYVTSCVGTLFVNGMGNRVILGPESQVSSVSLTGIDNTIEEELLSDPEDLSDTEEQLQAFPVSHYKPKPSDRHVHCSICLAEFMRNDYVKRLSCLHFFHPDCIDNWLRRDARCPLCLTRAWN